MKNIIKIHLRDNDNYKNTYNEEILSYELSHYILEETKGINTKTKIKFSISSDFELSEIEKNNLVDMIRNNFGADISELINEYKKQLASNYLILLIGIIFLIIYTTLKIEIISEFILVPGWVLCGEAICNFLYKTIENRYKVARRKQIVNAKVIFEENEVSQ